MRFQAKQNDKNFWGIYDTLTNSWILIPLSNYLEQDMIDYAKLFEEKVSKDTEIIFLKR